MISARARSDCGGTPFFFFNDTATTEIYTLSLHDALPISVLLQPRAAGPGQPRCLGAGRLGRRAAECPSRQADRKSTRLNSSHLVISYAVFCLKKKKAALVVGFSSRRDY